MASKKFWYYLAWDYTFRSEGQKTCWYEIIEQLFWNCPDYIVCPIWWWTNLHAIYKWIREFQLLWIINKIPKLIWVQTPWCNPVYKAFKEKRKDFDVQENPSTIASAMAVWDPADWEKILSDIYESKWIVVEVTDNQILLAQAKQSKNEWIFAEPSWAMALAAVTKLNDKNKFKKDDVIVCIANWNWLKDPKAPLKLYSQPTSIEPNFEEVERYVDQKLYSVWKNILWKEKDKILFKNKVNAKELETILRNEYWINADKNLINAVTQEITDFLRKWKSVNKTDLKFILEEILDEIHLKEKTIEIIDFKAETELYEKAKANLQVMAFWEEIHISSQWVWLVDATINALKKWLIKHDKLRIQLEDYEVEIGSKWSDATVTVKMTLSDKNWNKVLAKTTSPDVIIASIKAYEKWFNLLYGKKD